MNDTPNDVTHISDRTGVTDGVRVQILTAEHASLVATRSMTWNEVFSRAGMLVTVLSASVVALALVAQATNFGPLFRLFALLLLPIVLLIGETTLIRLGDANKDDFGLIVAMNRLRHAYLELAPELEPYFTTGHDDDETGIARSYGYSYRVSLGRMLAGTPVIVVAINAVVTGVIGALLGWTLGASDDANLVLGIIAALASILGHARWASATIRRERLAHRARFSGGREIEEVNAAVPAAQIDGVVPTAGVPQAAGGNGRGPLRPKE
jgi:hypothetical protein